MFAVDPASCIVFDNGAETLRFGYASELSPRSLNNSSGMFKGQPRRYIADEMEGLRNTSGLCLSRPFERGILTNWQCQMEIWSRAFDLLGIRNLDLGEKSLIVTSAPFAPEAVVNDMNEVVFEELGFAHYITRPSAWFSAFEYGHDTSAHYNELSSCCSLVVDSGFSFTHSMPWIDMKTRAPVCRRVNVGGKLLTNYLKELVSYRQYNMMDEFLLMNQVKLDLCYVSADPISELRASRLKGSHRSDPTAVTQYGERLRQFYVLPDFHTVLKGYVKPQDDPPSPNEQVGFPWHYLYHHRIY